MLLFSSHCAPRFWATEEKRTCTFVFIGRDLDKEALINGFQKCKVTEELRFKVGDAVEARPIPQNQYRRVQWKGGETVCKAPFLEEIVFSTFLRISVTFSG